MGFAQLYEKLPFQTATISFLVAGLAGPLAAALLGLTNSLILEAFHDKKDTYRPQDKIHEFAISLYSMTDVALAGFLVTQLRSSTQNLKSAWIAVATHQFSYLAAAASSFGFQKTMLPSLGVASMAAYFALSEP